LERHRDVKNETSKAFFPIRGKELEYHNFVFSTLVRCKKKVQRIIVRYFGFKKNVELAFVHPGSQVKKKRTQKKSKIQNRKTPKKNPKKKKTREKKNQRKKNRGKKTRK
jgi:hypothetical protein